MSIHIFNSLTKKRDEFIPIEGKKVRMYSCGVTVYDQCHIGHARSLYVFDVIRRYLKFRGYDVTFVRNITDVDDKIINKANELKKTSEQVSKENIESYYRDLKALAIETADVEPKATDHIKEMIDAISQLINKGMAYQVGSDVYYNVRGFKDYGKLSGQSIDHMMEAVRIDPSEKKKDPLDFTLWKGSKPGEPSWPSPWGAGRPGWHIECTCMSLKHLKTQTLDIHAGGRDLIFPHHENELAQSEALTGKTFAKYWIHHGLLTINSQKMSKSLGNFITIQDVLKSHSVDTLKMFFLFSHYASPIDYTENKMQDAKKALDKIDILFWKVTEILKGRKDLTPIKAGFIDKYKHEFIDAMDDDFNTPKALAALFNFTTDINSFIQENKDDPNYYGVIYHAVDVLENLCRQVLGLFQREPTRALTSEEESLLNERIAARAAKNFKRSDELRDLLKEKGIIVEDSKSGQSWRFA